MVYHFYRDCAAQYDCFSEQVGITASIFDDLHYWHPSLPYLAARRRPAEVRLEPEDPYRVYALVNKDWLTCLANGEMQFRTKSDIERQAESIRILDRRKARTEAKADADEILIKLLIEKDEISLLPAPAFDDNQTLISCKSITVTLFSQR